MVKQKSFKIKSLKRIHFSNKCNVYTRCLVFGKEHASLICSEIYANIKVSKNPINKCYNKEEKTETSPQKKNPNKKLLIFLFYQNLQTYFRKLWIKLKGHHSCFFEFCSMMQVQRRLTFQNILLNVWVWTNEKIANCSFGV